MTGFEVQSLQLVINTHPGKITAKKCPTWQLNTCRMYICGELWFTWFMSAIKVPMSLSDFTIWAQFHWQTSTTRHLITKYLKQSPNANSGLQLANFGSRRFKKDWCTSHSSGIRKKRVSNSSRVRKASESVMFARKESDIWKETERKIFRCKAGIWCL